MWELWGGGAFTHHLSSAFSFFSSDLFELFHCKVVQFDISDITYWFQIKASASVFFYTLDFLGSNCLNNLQRGLTGKLDLDVQSVLLSETVSWMMQQILQPCQMKVEVEARNTDDVLIAHLELKGKTFRLHNLQFTNEKVQCLWLMKLLKVYFNMQSGVPNLYYSTYLF